MIFISGLLKLDFLLVREGGCRVKNAEYLDWRS